MIPKKLKFKVSVSAGLFNVARGEEIATVIRKVGYALTRGTSAIEISGDVPHEIDFTEGRELRYISEKQKIDLSFHGSLQVPMCMPERVQWREAQDHLEKSIKSGVYGGCSYVNFHSCLHFWVEMMTYAGSRLENIMSDWDGRFISEILWENPKLIKWFIWRFFDRYQGAILGSERLSVLQYKVQAEFDTERERIPEKYGEESQKIDEDYKKGKITLEEGRRLKNEIQKKIDKDREDLRTDKFVDKLNKMIKERLEEFLSDPNPRKRRDWYVKERGDFKDACEILANALFLTQDPIWIDMVKMYEDVLKKYNYNPGEAEREPFSEWVSESFEKAEEEGDMKFKEFYYGVVGAKFMRGHLIKLFRWMADHKNGLFHQIEVELDSINPPNKEEEKKKLKKVLRNIKITIENPDARDPSHAGRYMLWHPKQIYVSVKHTKRELKEKWENPYHDKIFMLIDFEQLATQGTDPLHEIKDLTKVIPDVGKFISGIHANYPTPLHSHLPIEMGDIHIYRLLWELKEAEMGKHHTTYLVFERGGFKDPYKMSVTALRLMIKFLDENIEPKNLPPEFFGISSKLPLAEERQWGTIHAHAMDPLKGMLKVPEEEHTAMSKAAIEEERKKPEDWKKEEYR